MAPPENYAPPGNIKDASEFKRLALSVVGNRKYVHALELVSQIASMVSGGRFKLPVKRSMACDVISAVSVVRLSLFRQHRLARYRRAARLRGQPVA
jgi:hypothetical protein